MLFEGLFLSSERDAKPLVVIDIVLLKSILDSLSYPNFNAYLKNEIQS